MSRHVAPENAHVDIGPLFVKHLADDNVIEDNIFAFYLESFVDESATRSSYIDFGQAKREHMSNIDDLVWLPLHNHFFWMSQKTRAVRIGEDEYVFADDREVDAVFDSGSSVILVPKSLFEPLMSKLTDYIGKDKMWY